MQLDCNPNMSHHIPAVQFMSQSKYVPPYCDPNNVDFAWLCTLRGLPCWILPKIIYLLRKDAFWPAGGWMSKTQARTGSDLTSPREKWDKVPCPQYDVCKRSRATTTASPYLSPRKNCWFNTKIYKNHLKSGPWVPHSRLREPVDLSNQPPSLPAAQDPNVATSGSVTWCYWC